MYAATVEDYHYVDKSNITGNWNDPYGYVSKNITFVNGYTQLAPKKVDTGRTDNFGLWEVYRVDQYYETY